MSDAKFPRVAIYFEGKKREVLFKKVMKLSAKTGVSVSSIGYLALQHALPTIAEQLEGVYLDAAVHAELEEKKRTPYKI